MKSIGSLVLGFQFVSIEIMVVYFSVLEAATEMSFAGRKIRFLNKFNLKMVQLTKTLHSII